MPPSGTPERRLLRVRLTAEPASVPGARRFVRDGLTEWGRQSLVDDASLCVTEMAANAALHSGSSYMDVVVHDLERHVRVSVQDAGELVPIGALVPQRTRRLTAADRGALPIEEQSMTGRGLAIVSVLSSSWGIDVTDDGRRIWADLTGDAREHAVRGPRVAPILEATPGPAALPAAWKTIRMPGCPTALGLRIDQHLDDVIRELQLVDGGGADDHPRDLARLIERLVTQPAFARHMGRRVAQDAADAGLELVDIEMTVPEEVGSSARELLDAVALADRLCEERALLTLASTPDMVSLRTWFTECIVTQIEDDAEPMTYADWLAARS